MDTFLTAAEKCTKGGHFMGLGLSTCTDAINMAGAVFQAYGANLVDKDGNITVKGNDKIKEVLEWFQKLAKTLPDEVFAYDNASNNKSIISGQTSLIFNPPSAYAVARRDAPKVAEQLWTFSSPKGPKGRFDRAALSARTPPIRGCVYVAGASHLYRVSEGGGNDICRHGIGD